MGPANKETPCPLPTPGSIPPLRAKDPTRDTNVTAAPRPSFHQAIARPANMPTRRSGYRRINRFPGSPDRSWSPTKSGKGIPRSITRMLPIRAIVRKMFARKR